MTNHLTFTSDDFFVLANACSTAISLGKGSTVRKIVAFLQTEQPMNARGFVMEALYLHSEGHHQDALTLLETSNAMNADDGRDEALGIYVVLLSALGREGEAIAMGQALLSDDNLQTDAVRYMVGSIIEKSQEQATRTH